MSAINYGYKRKYGSGYLNERTRPKARARTVSTYVAVPRRLGLSRTSSGRDNIIHNFVRHTFTGAKLAGIASAVNGYGFVFTLADLSNYTNFTSLFDQYRIVKVTCKFFPRQNVATNTTTATTTQTANPCVMSVIDYDDASTPATIAGLTEFENFKVHNQFRPWMRSLVPHTAGAVAGGGVFTSFGNFTRQWVDCASTTVAYYGLKVIVDACVPSQTALPTWDCWCSYYLQFRNVR